MSKKWRWRFLKSVVFYCVAFSSAVVIAGLFVCWRKGFDPSSIVSTALMFFGGELLLSCLTKILERKESKTNERETDEADGESAVR